MTLQQLRYLIVVAETGNITQAAQRLLVSQPSITASIHELEKEMNLTLFLRQNKGVTLTRDGERFLGYARKVIDEADELEDTFKGRKEQKPHFTISCQHYSFAVNAFVELIREFDASHYDFTIREEETPEIIEDVANMKSELGILYLSYGNEKILRKIFSAYGLTFTELFTAKPHVFISSQHPLAGKEVITLRDLKNYPYLTYEQGVYNSFYYQEEFLDSTGQKKNIRVQDRATLFNLLIGLDGYTVCSGVISHALNGDNIIAKPLKMKEFMKIGYIMRRETILSRYGKVYLSHLQQIVGHMEEYE